MGSAQIDRPEVNFQRPPSWKRSLIYYLGKLRNGFKINWIVHELMAKGADDNNTNNPKRTTGEKDMQVGTLVLKFECDFALHCDKTVSFPLDGYAICKIHMKRSKLESEDSKEECDKTGQRKRKSTAFTRDGCKAPHKDLDNRHFHAKSLFPVPGPNDSAPLEPWDQAAIAKLLSMCGSFLRPDKKQQQPQATEKGTTCFEHANTPNDPIINAYTLDMFDLWETQEQQRQQMANHGAINQSHPNVP